MSLSRYYYCHFAVEKAWASERLSEIPRSVESQASSPDFWLQGHALGHYTALVSWGWVLPEHLQTICERSIPWELMSPLQPWSPLSRKQSGRFSLSQRYWKAHHTSELHFVSNISGIYRKDRSIRKGRRREKHHLAFNISSVNKIIVRINKRTKTMNTTVGDIEMPVSLNQAKMKIKKQVNPRKGKAGRNPGNTVTVSTTHHRK